MNDTLSPDEHHPAADSALRYIQGLGLEDLLRWREAFASCAIEGNRLAEVCVGTLNRLINREPVSDRYLLGLAWTIREPKTMTTEQEKPLCCCAEFWPGQGHPPDCPTQARALGTHASETRGCLAADGRHNFHPIDETCEVCRAPRQAAEGEADTLAAFGYAPGEYLRVCHLCKRQHGADKRATTCEDCARALAAARAEGERAGYLRGRQEAEETVLWFAKCMLNKANSLTPGNVAHSAAQIKGMASDTIARLNIKGA